MAEKRNLVSPFGGSLVDLMVPLDERSDAFAYAKTLPSLQLSQRSLCDLELLATGGFSPLNRFMGEADYRRVLEDMRLGDGTLFPVPITLPADELPAGADSGLALRDANNDIIGIMTIEEVFAFDRDFETNSVLDTTDVRHPLVAEMHRWGRQYVSGPLRVLRLPRHDDFLDLRMTPSETRAMLKSVGRSDVVAFQTRNPLHRAHEEMTKRAIADTGGTLLLQPVVGMTKPGDVDHFTRVRTYRALIDRHYPRGSVVLALLPLAMRMAGPREAVWHAIIRRNYGANHFIVGRDHASPGVNSEGKPFYGPYDAQKLVGSLAEEIGVQPRFYNEFVYLPDEDRYEEASRIPKEARTQTISGTQVRDEYLNRGRALPSWFTRPEVASILAESYPPRHKQGICIWFTGFSGAGKTATAEILVGMLMEHGRQSTVLDGDVVRTHLSAGLGFSRQDRDINIRRIGFVAAEVVRHGGIAVCAAVSPYRAARNDVRNMMKPGEFLEVFVDTPLEVCEQRDTKGMYAKARRGEISGFTGVDDPYEEPLDPEIRLDTVRSTAKQNARRIFDRLLETGFIRRQGEEISAG